MRGMATVVVDADDTEGIKRALHDMAQAGVKRRTQNGGGSRPVDSETRERIEAMARTGQHSRNAIARECGVSPSTVSKIAKAAVPPITFDRTAAAAATEARVQDAKSRRATLADALLDDLDRLRAMAFTEHTVKHVTKDGDLMEYQDVYAPGDLRNLFTAIGIALDKHAMLARFDSDDRDLPAVEVFLRGQGVPSLFGGAA